MGTNMNNGHVVCMTPPNYCFVKLLEEQEPLRSRKVKATASTSKEPAAAQCNRSEGI